MSEVGEMVNFKVREIIYEARSELMKP